MTLDEMVAGVQGHPKKVEAMKNLCVSVFSTPEGTELLRLLTTLVPPEGNSISTEGSNDPMAVGVREGRREFCSFLYRYAGKPRL